MSAERLENVRWNFTVNVLDVGLFFLGLGFAGPYTIIPVFVHEHCTSPFLEQLRPLLVGLIAALGAIGWHLPQLLTAGYVEGLSRRKPFVLVAGFFQRVPFLCMAAVALFMGRAGPGWLLSAFFALYALQSFSAGFVATAWQELIATVIPRLRRGLFFGTAFLLGGILMVAGGQLAGLFLHYLPRPENYALCFALCFLSTMASWCFLAQTREQERIRPRERHSFRDYLRRLPGVIRADRNWRAYMISQFAVVPAGIICVFIPVWGKFVLGISDYEVGLMTSCAAFGETVGNPLLGYVGDRRGHKLGLSLASLALVGALGAVLAEPNRVGLYVSLFLVGVYTAGRKVSGTAIAFEFCEPEDRPTYIGLTNTCCGPFFALGAFGGGALVIYLSYRCVFWIAAVLGAFGLLYLLWAVKEPRHVRLYTSNSDE